MMSLDCGIYAINRQRLKSIFAVFYKHFSIPPNQITSLSFVSKQIIYSLNKSYRNKSRTTDVLSFRYPQSSSHNHLDVPELYGQILLCPSVMLQRLDLRKRLYGKKSRALLVCQLRVLRLLAHAFCHLVGYDHETRPEYLRMIRHENQLIRKACKHCNLFGVNFLKML